MADTFFIEGLNTLPEQVQINKEDIKTNTADITKLKDDISKIKPNAWEERKFKIQINNDGELIDFTTYNPITDTNTPVNIQKAFTDKDTYLITDVINSYSFVASATYNGNSTLMYVVCMDPSLTIGDIFDPSVITKNLIRFSYTKDGEDSYCNLYINCDELKANNRLIAKTLYIGEPTGPSSHAGIDKISDNDVDNAPSTLLSASAIYHYYLKKSDASNTYLTKTDASTTYATKTELSNANKRIDALDTGTFDIALTTPGLEKIKANVTIGSPITLTKDTDFSEYIDGVNTYKTILFSIYTDQSEDYYISEDIKLDVGYTADVYGDNDQYYTWLTGIGVIKLGPKPFGNNYLCYISYSQGYTSPLIITPIQKLA